MRKALHEIASLSGLAVKARIVVEGALTGLHRAQLHGASVEFAEHKEYSPGDEIRHIDWKTYARNDRYYVKQFERESELTAHLVLDASASMSYAGAGLRKMDYAAELLAALAYLLLRQQDKVGLYVFGEEKYDRYVPPRARPAHFHDLCTVLEEVSARGPAGTESLSAALERTAELVRGRRNLIAVASDLFDPSGRALDVLAHLRARGHDVVLFHTLDPDELALPFRGLVEFEALEGERRLLCHPAAIRKSYQDKLSEFLEQARSRCVENGIEYRPAPTGLSLERALVRFLAARAGGDAPIEEGVWSF